MKTAAYPPDRNPAGQIMNMSAPPRTTVTVSTCRTVSVKGRDTLSSRAGLIIRLNVSRDHALRCNIPGYFKPRCRVEGSRKKILSGAQAPLFVSFLYIPAKHDGTQKPHKTLHKEKYYYVRYLITIC